MVPSAMSFSFGAAPTSSFGAASTSSLGALPSSSATPMTGVVGSGAMSSRASKAEDDAPQANLVGIFSGDWATDDKVALLAETYTVFNSLQKIAAEARSSLTGAGPSSRAALATGVPSPQTLRYFHRISGLYRDALRRYLLNLEASDDALLTDVEQAQLLHTILHLAETLYLPADGRGAGVVGEEILHWLNTFDFAPRTEEGQEIAQSAVPYQHPVYWDYILRCVLRGFHSAAASVLQSLSQHPSKSIQGIVSRTAKLLSALPRSTAFSLETDFVSAHRRWLTQVRSTLGGLEADLDEMEAEMARLGTDAEQVEDERLEFEAQFRCLLELMAGVKDRVFEACEDWREALGAWGTLVQPAMKRDDLPEIMDVVLKHFPIEASPQAEAVQAALAKGEVVSACELSRKVDPWLAVHLTDLLEKVGVVENDDDDDDEGGADGKSAQALRDGFIRTYAETLLDDQGLWRLSLDYLAACERGIAESRRRMREILLDVPLLGEEAQVGARGTKKSLEDMEREAEEAEMDEEELDPARAKEERERRKEEQREREKVSDEFGRVEEVLRACMDHGMELEARAICKHLATQMASERRYGVAVSYAVRAGDGRQVKRIADQLLDEYVEHGADVFCDLVDSMPASLLQDAATVSASLDDVQGRLELEDDDDDDEKMSILGAAAAGGVASSAARAQGYGLGRKVFSSRLTFLARYRDFHLLYAQGLLGHAASLLVQLLESNVAPERFWAILLVDAIPLLEGGGGSGASDVEGESGGSEDLFSMHQTFEMLRILEQITAAMQSGIKDEASHYLEPLERLLQGGAAASAPGKAKDLGKLDLKAATKRLDVVRFGLARQLARCSVHAVAH